MSDRMRNLLTGAIVAAGLIVFGVVLNYLAVNSWIQPGGPMLP